MLVARPTPEDARAIAHLHVAAWQVAYKDLMPSEYLDSLSVADRETLWRTSISRNVPDVLVAREEDTLLGFAAFGACRDPSAPEGCGEIWALYVAPSRWSTGVGRQLWHGARQLLSEQGYRTVSLWVLAQNARAIRFYESFGFRREPNSTKEWRAAGAVLQEFRYVASLDE